MAARDLKITKQAEGVIYRNPKPHVKSIHAYFPSIADLGGGEMLCSMVLGEAFESVDCRACQARSYDYGLTWTFEGRMWPDSFEGNFSEQCRLTCCPDGELVALTVKCDRHRSEEGLGNPETLGFVETDFFLYRSKDKGRSWSGPEPLKMPLTGPSFETCCSIIQLHDGKWMLPTSTWKGWDGWNPTGMKAVAAVSSDQGRTWPCYTDVMDGIKEGVIYWEQKIVEIKPGKLLSVAWAYDTCRQCDLHNAYSMSEDGGRSFAVPQDTGLHGQTPALLSLGNDTVLCAYRRMDIPGLWMAVVSVEDNRWEVKEQLLLRDANSAYVGSASSNQVENFNVLRFGAPCLTRLDNGDIYVTYWCVEDSVSNIRWIKLICDC